MTILPNPALMDRNPATLLYSGFLGLPGLRGLWYPGSQTEAGLISDMSDQGRTLTYNGNPTLNTLANGVAYEDLDGTGDFHSRVDEAGLDILGTETTIAAALRGMMLGGWVWLDAVGANQGFIGKWLGATNQRSYVLYFDAASVSFRMGVSSNGTNQFVSAGGPVTVAGTWNFVVGRFTPSVNYGTFQNGVWANTTTTPPAALFNSTTALNVGAFDAANNMDGRWAMAFLASALWSDDIVDYLFKLTRGAFGV